jgi:pimeloyl-ACP methyl ester carboxylesterase
MKYTTYWDKKNIPFLILHGWGWSSKSWEQIASLLSDKFFVIIPDIPCASKLVDCEKIYTLDDYTLLLKDFINDIQLEDFILLWHSNGGAIASKLVVNYPELKIKKLILNNSAWIRKDTKRSIKRKVFWFISKIVKPIFSLPWMWKIRNLFYKIIWWHDYLDAEKNPNKKQTYLNMINEDLQNIFSLIKKDTLLIWWKNDTYTPLEDGKKIHNLIPNSKLMIIENVRHGIHLQNPEALVKTILENL